MGKRQNKKLINRIEQLEKIVFSLEMELRELQHRIGSQIDYEASDDEELDDDLLPPDFDDSHFKPDLLRMGYV